MSTVVTVLFDARGQFLQCWWEKAFIEQPWQPESKIASHLCVKALDLLVGQHRPGGQVDAQAEHRASGIVAADRQACRSFLEYIRDAFRNMAGWDNGRLVLEAHISLDVYLIVA